MPTNQRRKRSARDRLLGAVVAAGVLALVAVPAFYTALFAVAGFSGCFLECNTPDPMVGMGWSIITLVLLALPIAAGLVATRVRSKRGWLIVAVVVCALYVIYKLSQRVI